MILTKKSKWTLGFLGVTFLAFIMEICASFDTSPLTQSWTLLITRNISPWVTFPVIIGLFSWLIPHFIKYYKRAKEEKKINMSYVIPQ